MKNADLPAMPITITEHTQGGFKDATLGMVTGLTKREHFAGLVMQGLATEIGRYNSPDDMAHDAVKLAGALLAELERTE